MGPAGLDPASDVATWGCQQSDVMSLLFIRLGLTTPRRLDYEGEEARAGRPGGDLKTDGSNIWVTEERGQG